jgi:hypothetical protein
VDIIFEAYLQLRLKYNLDMTKVENFAFGQKAAEREVLDLFISSYKNFPKGKIIESEKPDFIIKSKDGILGIELVRFFQQDDRKERAQQHRMLFLARRQFLRACKTPINLSVKWGIEGVWDGDTFLSDTDKLLNAAQFFVNEGKQKRTLNREELEQRWGTGGIESLTISLGENQNTVWKSSPERAFSKKVSIEELQNVLEHKNHRYEKYRRQAESVWLLVYTDEQTSIEQNKVEEIIKKGYESNFDQTLLFDAALQQAYVLTTTPSVEDINLTRALDSKKNILKIFESQLLSVETLESAFKERNWQTVLDELIVAETRSSKISSYGNYLVDYYSVEHLRISKELSNKMSRSGKVLKTKNKEKDVYNAFNLLKLSLQQSEELLILENWEAIANNSHRFAAQCRAIRTWIQKAQEALDVNTKPRSKNKVELTLS